MPVTEDTNEKAAELAEFLASRPEMHNQDLFLCVSLDSAPPPVSLDAVRRGEFPGMEGCAAGMAAVLWSPPGAVYERGLLRFTDGTEVNLFSWARDQLQVSQEVARELFFDATELEAVEWLSYIAARPGASVLDLRALGAIAGKVE